jgi:hypothetical protein
MPEAAADFFIALLKTEAGRRSASGKSDVKLVN